MIETVLATGCAVIIVGAGVAAAWLMRRQSIIFQRCGLEIAVVGRNIHVIPTGDGIRHAEADDCPCGPTSGNYRTSSGLTGWLVEHQTSLAELRR